MNENLKDVTSHLIEKYINILEENGEPNEAYKYLAINTFQQNWDIEADDFYQMFRASFSKVANLLYQNSWGFIEKSAHLFPDEVRQMFRNLYDESIEISQRIKTFQSASENILPKVRQALNRTNINAQQDERTISVYLAFRFPEKYIFYKSDYYKSFCEQLHVKTKKSGERFLHFQELASQIIRAGLIDDENFVNIHRQFYPKPDWDDRYLMIQNMLYVVFREDLTTNEESIIWEKALKYAYKQDVNLWQKTRNFVSYAIEYKGVFYPNKFIIHYCVEFIEKTYPDFDLVVPHGVGKKLNAFLKSKGANAVMIKDAEHEINTMPNITNKMPLNQILFGAPGTGKTYNTKRIAVEIINGEKARTREEINAEYEDLVNAKQIVFTTFHQSLSYEDFIEGIKPETTDGNVTYEVKDGIFKSLCQNANPKNTVSFENAYEKLQEKLVENETIELKTPTNKTFSIALNKNGNLSLMTGSKREKQGVLTKEKLIGQLNGEQLFIGWEGYFNGVIDYLLSEFNFNPEAKEDSKNYVLIIDEINRGNVSAIFGELITLIEESKRAGREDAVEVILPYSKEKFSVPSNVYVIGTMNTADRSVEALDTALRRCFSFVEMQPNPNILLNSEYQDLDLKRLLETINQRIEVLVDKDHQIGHSYFIGIQNLDDLKLVFKDKIIPLLEEYFYGDFGKIGLVLGGSFIYQEENKAKFAKNFSYENDFLEDKKVYRFTPFENWNEQTFISVYED